MPNNNPDFLTLLLAFLVSVASGVVGILNKITEGRPFQIIWVVGEFIAAMLCGYLAYDSYPLVKQHTPEWVTMPVLVAACSYTGGKLLQVAGAFIGRYTDRLL